MKSNIFSDKEKSHRRTNVSASCMRFSFTAKAKVLFQPASDPCGGVRPYTGKTAYPVSGDNICLRFFDYDYTPILDQSLRLTLSNFLSATVPTANLHPSL